MSTLTVRQQLRLLTVSRAECSRWLELRPSIITKLIDEGALRLVEVGRARRIPWDDVTRVMRALIQIHINRPDAAHAGPAFALREANGTRANGADAVVVTATRPLAASAPASFGQANV